MDAQTTIPGTAPKVEAKTIDALMQLLTFRVSRVDDTTTTLAVATLPSGFTVAIGQSACVSPENFDAQLGVELAIKNAKTKARERLWDFEGYALAKRLTEPGANEAAPRDWRERLQAEERELTARVQKLTDFLSGNGPEALDNIDRALLVAQGNAMSVYLTTLRLRLARI